MSDANCRQIELVFHDDCGEQARFLVRGIDDVLWTDDVNAAFRYMAADIVRLTASKP